MLFRSHSLHSAAEITPQQIVAVIGHRREQVGPAVAEVAKELPVPVSTAIQEEQNGTGHAIQCAMNLSRKCHESCLLKDGLSDGAGQIAIRLVYCQCSWTAGWLRRLACPSAEPRRRAAGRQTRRR